ncbi:MAG: HAMP domain-containing histidine kinase [Oligoflexales bacterium]|nr:HAMP domain-containing histidine kinase [Oligoflexales bacterium]
MGRQINTTFDNTIAKYIRAQFKKQAILTGLLLLLISLLVFSASIKFATDRYVRGICQEVSESARILVETSRVEFYQSYFSDVVTKLKNQFEIENLVVVKQDPDTGWRHYSLGVCSINWQSDFKVAFYTPSHWAGDAMYVRGIITPRFVRSDLILFIIAVCIVLFSSYFFGTRSFLRKVQYKISGPIHDVWDGLRTGIKPKNLEIKEISDLWHSLVEYKELLIIRNRMLLAKEYYHEVKSPAFYQYNQLKRLTVIEDPIRQKEIIAETLEMADELISQMEKALKKIATDDYGRHPKNVDLAALIRQRDAKYKHSNPIQITGDKTLIKTLIHNLYSNAIQACGDMGHVETTLEDNSNEIALSIRNPVRPNINIDTSMVFVSGFTTRTDGTGLGLSLCQHIVELHDGTIKADFSREKRTFEITVKFPKEKEAIYAGA